MTAAIFCRCFNTAAIFPIRFHELVWVVLLICRRVPNLRADYTLSEAVFFGIFLRYDHQPPFVPPTLAGRSDGFFAAAGPFRSN
jgi:hypothetical protein